MQQQTLARPATVVALAALIVVLAAADQGTRSIQAQTSSPIFGPSIAEGDYEDPDSWLGDWFAFSTTRSSYNPLGYFLVMWTMGTNQVSVASPCAMRPWGVLFRWTSYRYLRPDPENTRFWQTEYAGQMALSADPVGSTGFVAGEDMIMLFWAGPTGSGQWSPHENMQTPITLGKFDAVGLSTTIPGYTPERDEVIEGCDPVFLAGPPNLPVPNGPGATPPAVPRPSVAPSPRPTVAPSSTPQTCSWTGRWTSRAEPDLVLNQTGSQVTGTFGFYGNVQGSASGDTLTATATDARGRTTQLRLRMNTRTNTAGSGDEPAPGNCIYMSGTVGGALRVDFQR